MYFHNETYDDVKSYDVVILDILWFMSVIRLLHDVNPGHVSQNNVNQSVNWIQNQSKLSALPTDMMLYNSQTFMEAFNTSRCEEMVCTCMVTARIS